jgi:5-methylcytosine-specific restriction endonuclease McrA
MSVFVIGSDKRPLMPCSEKRARLLLTRKKATVVKMYPFTIMVFNRTQDNSELQNIEVKIDPGSKTTGICISRTVDKAVNVLNLFELEHRGKQISEKLKLRAILRRARRQRNTRYRKARFLNRTRAKGWLPPSLQHRVDTTMPWVYRFQRYLPVTSLAVERVKFDMQKMNNPDIHGVQYQQGTLFEYEVKEYLLQKWERKCAYCGASNVILEKEHIVPRARGGSDSISNLTLSCMKCNRSKAALPIEVFLSDRPEVLKKIMGQLRKPLKDAAVVNATRNALFSRLLATGLPVAAGIGAETKYNRNRFGVPKTHALDAACVGDIFCISKTAIPHVGIKCIGRGVYQRTAMDKYGFPRLYFPRVKRMFGFSTGDMVKLHYTRNGVTKDIFTKIIVKSSGYFAFRHESKVVSIKHTYCDLIQKVDGYSYSRAGYLFNTV